MRTDRVWRIATGTGCEATPSVARETPVRQSRRSRSGRTVEPIFDEARRRGRRIRLLVQVGPEYEGFTAGMAWEKAATGLRSFSTLRLFDGYAIVSDAEWIREWTHLVGFLLPFPLRVFGNDEDRKSTRL